MDKVVGLWNKGPGKKDRITVTVKKQASGDTLVTKILTAHKAGKAPTWSRPSTRRCRRWSAMTPWRT